MWRKEEPPATLTESRIDDPKKPYRCQVCPYATAWSGSFKRHFMSRHTDVKPYSCQECGYRTADVGNLKKHVTAKHTTERAFKCKLCDYGTINLSHLKRHVLNQHVGERPHFCSVCGYRAGQLSDIKKHIQNKHETTPPGSMVGCPHCEPRKKLGITSSEHFLSEIARLYEISAQKRAEEFKAMIKKNNEAQTQLNNAALDSKSAGERLYEYSVVKSGELLVTRISNPTNKRIFGGGHVNSGPPSPGQPSPSFIIRRCGSLSTPSPTLPPSGEGTITPTSEFQTYECFHCEYVSNYLPELRQHIRTQHKNLHEIEVH